MDSIDIDIQPTKGDDTLTTDDLLILPYSIAGTSPSSEKSKPLSEESASEVPLVIEESDNQPELADEYPEDDDYDTMREEEEKKMERYARLSEEEAERMNTEFVTVSVIPTEDSSSVYRQRNWFRTYESKLKQAKRKPRKPTTFCKYFLEYWSEHDEDWLELSQYNPEYEEIDKRKRATENGAVDDLNESIKKVKINQENKKPEAEKWKLPSWFEYKREVDDLCRNILLRGSPEYSKRNEIQVDSNSVDAYVKTSLKKLLEEEIASGFYKMKNKSVQNSVVQSILEKQPEQEGDPLDVTVSLSKQYDPLTSIAGLDFGQLVHVKVLDSTSQELMFETLSFVDGIIMNNPANESDGPKGDCLVVKYKVILAVDSSWVTQSIGSCVELRPIGYFNHHYYSASSLINFKEFNLHQEIVNPIIKSFSSTVTASVTSAKVELDTFYKDSIQKALDTVVTRAPECSSICVIDGEDKEMLKEVIVPIAKSCLINELVILDPSRSDLQVLDEPGGSAPKKKKILDRLRLIITSVDTDSKLKIPQLLKDVLKSCKRDYKCFYVNSAERSQEWPKLDHIEEKAVLDLRARTNERQELTDEQIDHVQALTSAFENRSSGVQSASYAYLREKCLKKAKHTFLDDNQILIGTIPDLFNHDFLTVNFKKAPYYAAIVYNASSICDNEIITLLKAGVEKLVLIGFSGEILETNLMNRMVKEYEKNVKSFASASSSPVVSSFTKIEPPKIANVKKEPKDIINRESNNGTQRNPSDPELFDQSRGFYFDRGHDLRGSKDARKNGSRGGQYQPDWRHRRGYDPSRGDLGGHNPERGNRRGPNSDRGNRRGHNSDRANRGGRSFERGNRGGQSFDRGTRGFHNTNRGDRGYQHFVNNSLPTDSGTSEQGGSSPAPAGTWHPFGIPGNRTGFPGRGRGYGNRNRTNQPLSINDPMHPHYRPEATSQLQPIKTPYSQAPMNDRPIPQHQSPPLPGFEHDISPLNYHPYYNASHY